jgi:hypothetical protein
LAGGKKLLLGEAATGQTEDEEDNIKIDLRKQILRM